jgi:hypothetical protein
MAKRGKVRPGQTRKLAEEERRSTMPQTRSSAEQQIQYREHLVERILVRHKAFLTLPVVADDWVDTDEIPILAHFTWLEDQLYGF